MNYVPHDYEKVFSLLKDCKFGHVSSSHPHRPKIFNPEKGLGKIFWPNNASIETERFTFWGFLCRKCEFRAVEWFLGTSEGKDLMLQRDKNGNSKILSTLS